MDIEFPRLDINDSLQAFLDALMGFVNNVLNAVFSQLAILFNALDVGMLNISFG